MEISMAVPQKLKIGLPYDPAISPQDIYLKESKATLNQGILNPSLL
jgi:hypothetical protein